YRKVKPDIAQKDEVTKKDEASPLFAGWRHIDKRIITLHSSFSKINLLVCFIFH
ncbi:RNA-dependent DNA polymerase, partial [Avian myeloblastosis virus]